MSDYWISSDSLKKQSANFFFWRKMKSRDAAEAETMLRENENNYVSACGKFLSRESGKSCIWTLQEKKSRLSALLINSSSAFLPVLNGQKEIPNPDFLKSLLRKKKIHSIQGLAGEVQIFEGVLEKMGGIQADIFDYDLMYIDKPPNQAGLLSGPPDLVLRVPQLIDLEEIAPLQADYEHEEVLPKNALFSPAASRINLSNFIYNSQVLAAEIRGRIVGKINISSVSFTRYLVGGVYVHPDFRGMGIARRMASEFITTLINTGRGVTLFVKKNNIPARRLYTGLGFKVHGDYRIAYY
jgi:RimJ/RimL family protein N-acetyltransferase